MNTVNKDYPIIIKKKIVTKLKSFPIIILDKIITVPNTVINIFNLQLL